MDSPPLTPLAVAVLRVGRAPERVLQVACGMGEGALFLAREFPQARVRGVDPSAEAIRAAVDKIGLDPEGRIAFKVGEASALPYPDDHFDLVAQIDAPLSPSELARVLRPGGHLIVVSSSHPRVLQGTRQAWHRRRLARTGIESVEAADAGGGSFFVGHLHGGD